MSWFREISPAPAKQMPAFPKPLPMELPDGENQLKKAELLSQEESWLFIGGPFDSPGRREEAEEKEREGEELTL